MKANAVAFSRLSDPTTAEGDDADTGMRRSLGLGTASDADPAASSSNDPMKAARQLIRSQAALDYAERELVHAEATTRELRTKLHHAHREKDAALEAARLATAAKLAAQRSMLEAEASRDRSDRALREALAANRDLQAQLDGFARGFETAKAEPAAEHQPRLKADDSRREAPTVTAPKATLPASRDDAGIQTIRRPVGRPRKTAATAPAPASNKTGVKAMGSDETIARTAGKLEKKARNRQAAGQEPVQWWVEGWDGPGS
jgi:chromosome segregation ATPase